MTEVGGPQISSANCKSTYFCGLTKFVIFADLPNCGNLRFFELNVFCDLRTQFLADLNFRKFFTFLLTNLCFKMFQFKFLLNKKFGQIDLRPTFILFCYKGKEFFKIDVSFSLLYCGQFAD
jgi:hypothetical protein